MKNVSSSTSISSLAGVPISATASNMGQSSFEELVDKIFSCNLVLMLTDNAKQFVRQSFGGTATLVSILNQFQSIGDLKTTIRDLNGHNSYMLNKVRFRFFDVDQLKTRPNGAQLRKSHYDVIASMSNTYHKNVELESGGDENDQLELMNTTPWYDLWKNIYIDTFQQSDHDFIGAYVGCFFVITKHELPHYKIIFEKLCATVSNLLGLYCFHANCSIVCSLNKTLPSDSFSRTLFDTLLCSVIKFWNLPRPHPMSLPRHARA